MKVRTAAAMIVLCGSAMGAQAADSLLQAAQSGDSAAALGLVAGKADVNARQEDGTTALHWAAYHDDLPLLRQLIKAGAKVNVTNDYGSTPLAEAAERADPEALRILLQAGADVESPNAQGQTALMSVARSDVVEAARVLVAHGANVNATEKWRGQTALMWASAQSRPAMVQFLLEHGAAVNAREDVREWPRRVTAEPRPQNRPLGGLTPLLFAAREGCAACAAELIKAHADVELTDPEGITPLVMSILNAQFDTAAVLIKAGADVNTWDMWGRAALYSAVDYNTTPRGGRPDRPSSDQTTALQVIAMLLKRGANPDMQLKLFPPYRSLGQDRGGDAMLTVGTTPLIRAAKAGDSASIQLLLAAGARPDLANSLGITPLMAAAGIGSTTIDIRARFRNEQKCIAAAKLLLDHGVDVNATNGNGQTALYGAAQSGWNNFVQLLADHGATITLKDRFGSTPLDVAEGKVGTSGRPGVGAGGEVHKDTAALLTKLATRS
ncbi:MAG TPA: ankyrin repeat domain-containing protein [Steroidobacteraceae bacterium]|jgi:ankyrin repeat protein|nr:ankyrin repeat domain-containing protein [Steroidobacteraceae bacterium]